MSTLNKIITINPDRCEGNLMTAKPRRHTASERRAVLGRHLFLINLSGQCF